MRGFLGFILGVILTIAAAYIYDSSTGRAINGLPASAVAQAPVVNWNVLGEHWQNLTADVRVMADNLEKSVKQHS